VAVGDLVGGFGDGGGDTGGAQPLTVGAGGVRLVGEDRLGPGPGSTRTPPGHP